MGFFNKITGIFKKSKEESPTPAEVESPPELPPELPPKPVTETKELEEKSAEVPLPTTPPLPPLPKRESLDTQSLKAKIDLLITQVENLKVQSENINERLKMVEKLLEEMRRIRYY
ncbi:MAG TPA: hypothetical protein ENG45_00150 [Candidatus Aenigmarchaeota archaeon]|nr:hypothetical protein [Candidatus Aenigmarchaeota archaeon]